MSVAAIAFVLGLLDQSAFGSGSHATPVVIYPRGDGCRLRSAVRALLYHAAMPSRTRCRFNPHIQWFHPPVDSTTGRPIGATPQFMDGELVSVDPDSWALELQLTLDRLWTTDVGRAVMSCVRRRTTIYATIVDNLTDADPYADLPGEVAEGAIGAARAAASTTGARAMVWIGLNAPVRRRQGAVAWAPEASLLHELVHAVNVTWGNFQLQQAFANRDVQRLGVSSPEEEFAWVIDNMHRSERGMWLRGQYEGGEMVAPGRPLTGRRESELRVASRCNSKVRMLAARLEQIDARRCPYNPFREYAAMSPTARP